MTASLQCLECGTPLDSRETGGLCPKCLLKLGLANSTFGFTTTGLPQDGSGPLEFGSCRILRVLGKGGMGSVYEAEQRDGGRRVALKVLGQTLDTPELRSRFLREGQLAASVRHPNVVGILSAEEVDGTPVIVMELLHDGTLSERVKRDGPMAIATAVDAVLQIIDGLEAAHAVGVLHRDVKPANCFISSEGVVKVGDFGLSISTFAGLEQSLTQSGTLLGTPAFAAPEQLRGEDLDTRADIYSVGATLYYLLTGKTPHEADSLVALIAAVLTKRPADPRSLRQDIPVPLARVIMRCLERSKTQRPASYAALRSALEPFRTEAAQPAMLGLRAVAGYLDLFLSSVPMFFFTSRSASETLANASKPHLSLLTLGGALFAIAYFGLLEGRWGTTPGKMLCGLRVARVTGGYPGFGRAFIRALVFRSDTLLAALILSLWTLPPLVEGLIGNVLFLLIFVTMRRSNGFATLQDLASGTRVVSIASSDDESTIPMVEATGPASEDGERIGPFLVMKRAGSVIEAWDSALRRHVWIVESAAGSPPVSEPRRNLNRPGRLRWLQGMRSPDENWDAYEAPPGHPLDLATEFSATSRGGTRPSGIGFNRVWITNQGHAVWLEFPLSERDASLPLDDVATLQRFLALVGASCLGPNQPLHAMRLIETLSQERLDSQEMVAGNLRATLTFPAALTRRRRLVTLVLWPLQALAMSVLLAFSFQALQQNTDRYPHVESLHSQASGSQSADSTEAKTGTETIFVPSRSTTTISIAAGLFAFQLNMGTLFSIVWTAITGVPPGIHLFGLVLLTRSGRPAPRWLALIRVFLTGLVPILLTTGLVTLIWMTGAWKFMPIQALITASTFLAVAAFAVHAYLRPQRALPDLLLRTTIVPR
jgi:uncharacterized RDD family membrane protein YckC